MSTGTGIDAEEAGGMAPSERKPRSAPFRHLSLHSAFQPIFSLGHRRAVGHEALLRAQTADGTAVPPPVVFALAAHDSEAASLDSLTQTLHLQNYEQTDINDTWLFLNVSPRSIAVGAHDGTQIEDRLRACAIPTRRIVIEILEGAVPDRRLLSETVQYYKSLGCLIAVDDFGAGHSNFDRVWQLSPEFIKLDRSLVAQAVVDRRARKILPHLVSLIHETGALVVLEGIETEEEALIALESDADLAQGFLFAIPDASASMSPPAHLDRLCNRFFDQFIARPQTHGQRPYFDAFTTAVERVRAGQGVSEACAALLADPRVLRCFLLDQTGNQTGANYVSATYVVKHDLRFAPLAEPGRANWARRPYFRRAILHPESVQQTRPYFSIADARMCITLSQAFPINGRLFVLCCDMEPEEA